MGLQPAPVAEVVYKVEKATAFGNLSQIQGVAERIVGGQWID